MESRGNFGLRVLRFTSRDGFRETLDRLGHIPLPPYIKRADEPMDRERYQTVYARQGSAVAAPTAGLHFTPEILGRVKHRGIEIAEITLDVGLGTFEPVRTERLEDHKIHSETYEIPEPAAEALNRSCAATNGPSSRSAPRSCAHWKTQLKKAQGRASQFRRERPRQKYFCIRESLFAS